MRRVLGVDLSEEMVALLSGDVGQFDPVNASLRRMNAEALDVTPDFFDVALSSFLLDLLPRPASAAANLGRHCGPAGASAPQPPGSGRTGTS